MGIANSSLVIQHYSINSHNFFPHAAVDDCSKDDEPKPDQLSTASASDISATSNVSSNESVASPNIEVAGIEGSPGANNKTSNLNIATCVADPCSKVENSSMAGISSNLKEETSSPKSRTPSPKASPKRSPNRKVSDTKEGKFGSLSYFSWQIIFS